MKIRAFTIWSPWTSFWCENSYFSVFVFLNTFYFCWCVFVFVCFVAAVSDICVSVVDVASVFNSRAMKCIFDMLLSWWLLRFLCGALWNSSIDIEITLKYNQRFFFLVRTVSRFWNCDLSEVPDILEGAVCRFLSIKYHEYGESLCFESTLRLTAHTDVRGFIKWCSSLSWVWERI